MAGVDRRKVLVGAAALVAAGPAWADATVADLLSEIFGARVPKPGVISMKLSPIAENGLAVPITLAVDEVPSKVKRIVVLAPGNPFPRAAEYRFGTRTAKAEVATRIRLARSQTVVAIAELGDGTLWSASEEITITSGACAEIYDGR
ncbi:MAG TPA: thiosulfate oxidation carrier protein SoxY [Alphaproteobacteria bacterium]